MIIHNFCMRHIIILRKIEGCEFETSILFFVLYPYKEKLKMYIQSTD